MIKTHTARLDFCLYYRTYFFNETLSFTNRERRVIASVKKIIKTHTARLDFVDIIKPTFLRKRCRHKPPKTGNR